MLKTTTKNNRTNNRISWTCGRSDRRLWDFPSMCWQAFVNRTLRKLTQYYNGEFHMREIFKSYEPKSIGFDEYTRDKLWFTAPCSNYNTNYSTNTISVEWLARNPSCIHNATIKFPCRSQVNFLCSLFGR